MQARLLRNIVKVESAVAGICRLERRHHPKPWIGRTPLLRKQIERLHQLPKTQQKVVMQMLDGVLAQASR